MTQNIKQPKIRFDNNLQPAALKNFKLGDLFTERSERNTGNLPLLSITINYGVIKQDDSSKTDFSSEDKSNYKVVRQGDLAYNSMRMWQGAEGISDFDGIVSPAYTIVTPVNCYGKYFEYFFKTKHMLHEFQRHSQGLTSDTWNLKYPLFSKITVYIPSFAEQHKIADFLISIDKKISYISLKVSSLEQMKKGLMQQIFSQKLRFKDDNGISFQTWKEQPINEFAKCFTGATPSTKVPEYWHNGTINWMSSGEVNKGLVYSTERKISQAGFDHSSVHIVKPKTVVIALAGQGKTRGSVALVMTELCTNQSLAAIETNNSVNSFYLYYFLQLKYKELRALSSGDSGRGGLNLQLVNSFKVLVPCLAEQRKIANFLSIFDQKLYLARKELNALQTIKQGFMQQMFV